MSKLKVLMILWYAMLMMHQPGMGQVPVANDTTVATTATGSSIVVSTQATEASSAPTAGTTTAMATTISTPAVFEPHATSPKAAEHNINGATDGAAAAAATGKMTARFEPLIHEPRLGSSMGRAAAALRELALARAKRRLSLMHDGPKPRSAHHHKRRRHAPKPPQQQPVRQSPVMKIQPPKSPQYPPIGHLKTKAPSASSGNTAAAAAATANASAAPPTIYYNKVEAPESNFELKVFQMLSPNMAIETVQLKPYDHSAAQDMAGKEPEHGPQGDHSKHSSKHHHKRQSSIFDMLQSLLQPLEMQTPNEKHNDPIVERKTPSELYNSPMSESDQSPFERRHSREDPPLYAEYLNRGKPFGMHNSPEMENKSPFGMQHSRVDQPYRSEGEDLLYSSTPFELHNNIPKMEDQSLFEMPPSPLEDSQSPFEMLHSRMDPEFYHHSYLNSDEDIAKTIEMNRLKQPLTPEYLRTADDKTLLTNPNVVERLLDVLDATDAKAAKEKKDKRRKRQAAKKKDELMKRNKSKEAAHAGAAVSSCPVDYEPHGNRKGDTIMI